MNIKKLRGEYSVLKLNSLPQGIGGECVFTAVTDNEYSVVCESKCAPEGVISREDGFFAYRIDQALDFALIGIIAKISGVLAAEKISVFVVSTFDTDYFLVRKENADRAEKALTDNGYDLTKN